MSTTYPEVYEPAGIDSRGNVALFWVATLAKPNAPTMTELSKAVNLSKVAYRWDMAGTQNSTERGHYASQNALKSLGRIQYDPSELEYDYDPQKLETPDDEYKHVKALVAGAKGFLIDRRGIPASEPFKAGQILEAVMPVELGERFPVEAGFASEEGSKLRYRQTVSVVGDVLRGVAIAS